jgi:dipeptidyl aminopeptidase/acylaminoacyl peptidase
MVGDSRVRGRIDQLSIEHRGTVPCSNPGLVGGAIQEKRDKVARANPITYVSKDTPPFLILHGDQDPLVPVNQSELLYEALKKAGVSMTFHKIIGAGHGGHQFGTPLIRAMVQAFFDQDLKPADK